MFVVTFYLYKGGVGQTSPLMNCAYRLADMGSGCSFLTLILRLLVSTL